jgi:hypothetical protein
MFSRLAVYYLSEANDLPEQRTSDDTHHIIDYDISPSLIIGTGY